MAVLEPAPIFFSDQGEFRHWLDRNHKSERELWVGYYKKGTGLASMTWSESVDQALCYGWIDGLRKSIDEKSYKIRFTPRKRNSNWSDVNIRKVAKLKKKRLMRAAGLTAFEKRRKDRSGVYGYENEPLELTAGFETEFKQNKSAWRYLQESAPGYRKQAIGWIMSAKKEETRQRRLGILIKHCASEEKIPQFDWKKGGRNV